jgi:hypothetical protein
MSISTTVAVAVTETTAGYFQNTCTTSVGLLCIASCCSIVFCYFGNYWIFFHSNSCASVM